MYNVVATEPVINHNQSSTIDSASKTFKQIFHLSLSSLNIEDTRNFYQLNFDCKVKRITKSGKGIHLDFFGHQLTFVEVSPDRHRQNSSNIL